MIPKKKSKNKNKKMKKKQKQTKKNWKEFLKAHLEVKVFGVHCVLENFCSAGAGQRSHGEDQFPARGSGHQG